MARAATAPTDGSVTLTWQFTKSGSKMGGFTVWKNVCESLLDCLTHVFDGNDFDAGKNPVTEV